MRAGAPLLLQVFSRDVLNSMGLAGLNKLMLIYSHAEIARVLRVVADPRNHPVMIHCASGASAASFFDAICSTSSYALIVLRKGSNGPHMRTYFGFLWCARG